jgi:hypothetical protein
MRWKFFTAFLAFITTNWASDPSAEEILAAARMNPLGQEVALRAQLRAGSTKVPFTIEVRDGAVRYRFENPVKEIRLRLTDNTSILEKIESSKAVPVTDLEDSVRGGLITHEDLALGFLYWKNAKLLGSETVRTRDAWKLEVHPPAGSSQYGAVRVWIDKASAALLRIEGFDKSGKPAKRFEVVSAQKIDGQWMLKQMRVERIDPETRKTKGITYLEVLGARAD